MSLTVAHARLVFDYLVIRDDIRQGADLVIGFGHFDPKIPRRCLELHERGLARHMLFAGGMGSGTADLDQPEALFFAAEVWRLRPHLPVDDIIVECTSTNTAENVTFSVDLLEGRTPPLRFGRDVSSAVLVASPYRQRRVWLTCRALLPGVTLANAPPITTFEEELGLFASKGQRLPELLMGEIERIQRYGQHGFIMAAPIPNDVLAACEELRRAPLTR